MAGTEVTGETICLLMLLQSCYFQQTMRKSVAFLGVSAFAVKLLISGLGGCTQLIPNCRNKFRALRQKQDFRLPG